MDTEIDSIQKHIGAVPDEIRHPRNIVEDQTQMEVIQPKIQKSSDKIDSFGISSIIEQLKKIQEQFISPMASVEESKTAELPKNKLPKIQQAPIREHVPIRRKGGLDRQVIPEPRKTSQTMVAKEAPVPKEKIHSLQQMEKEVKKMPGSPPGLNEMISTIKEAKKEIAKIKEASEYLTDFNKSPSKDISQPKAVPTKPKPEIIKEQIMKDPRVGGFQEQKIVVEDTLSDNTDEITIKKHPEMSAEQFVSSLRSQVKLPPAARSTSSSICTSSSTNCRASTVTSSTTNYATCSATYTTSTN